MQYGRVTVCLVLVLIALGCSGRAELLLRYPEDAVGGVPVRISERVHGVFTSVGEKTVAVVGLGTRSWFALDADTENQVVLVLHDGGEKGISRGSAFVFSYGSPLSWRAAMRTLELRSQRCSSGAIRIDGEFLGDGVDLVPWRGTYNEKILDVRLILRGVRLRPVALSEIMESITGGDDVYPEALDILNEEFPPWKSAMAAEGVVVPSDKPVRDSIGVGGRGIRPSQ